MLINWFTVFAQIVNFLILVYLLKRFLYGPIIRAMQEREKKVALKMQSAEKARKEALMRSQDLDRQRVKLDEEKEQILDEAKKEVATWKENEVGQIREQISQQRQAWVDTVESEKQAFIQQLKQKVICQTLKISRKALCDLAGEDLERLAVQRFTEKIRSAIEENKHLISGIGDQISVRSGFEMDQTQQQQITQTLNGFFPQAHATGFDIDRNIGFGIELIAGDWKVSWNLAVYLGKMEEEVLASLASACGATP
ncbi:MAG: hypothetical protein PHP23_05590 [Desulfobacterales bacterium]|nr:hypothetical protein [Desulfobacterales bacterium]MDD4071546.1 hypothetical protein [Desulfobacterales bacterium]MDD4391832.1 hypothetical protein [Desulfobacterales bacterium]